MALYHVHLSYIGKGQQRGGAIGFHRYLEREDRGNASQFRRYLEREGAFGKDDLVAKGHGHLPAWAGDSPARFWAEADTRERAKGPVFFHLQITLPRELSPEGREALADDLRATLVERYPHSWEIHEPTARDGSGIQPHIHIQFSTRREDTEAYKTPTEWFAQAPKGIGKDPSWFRKARLHDVREAVALLTNVALTREGIALAVDHRSLEAQGLSRDPARYESAQDRADMHQTMAYRTYLRQSGTKAYEQVATYAGWQKQALHLASLDRQYIKDLARDHVWRYDKSPSRSIEREESMTRRFVLARQMQVISKGTQHPRQRTQEGLSLRQLAQALRNNEDTTRAGGKLTIRLHEDQTQEHGMEW